MADSDQVLKLLIKVEGELSKLNEAKTSLASLGDASKVASQGAQILGAALGAAIPTTLVGAVTAVITAYKAFEEEQNQLFQTMEQGRATVHAMATETLKLQQEIFKLGQLKDVPLQTMLQLVNQEMIRLKTEMALVTRGTKDGEEAFKNYNSQLRDAINLKVSLIDAMAQERAVLDQEAVTRARAFGTHAEIEQAKAAALYNQFLEQRKALHMDISHDTLSLLVYEAMEAEERTKLSPILRDQMTMLQNIRQTQQLIATSPFLGADAKQAALLTSSRQEMQNIAKAIQETEELLPGSAFDPAKYEQVEQRLQLLRFRFKQLQQDIPKLDFGGGLRAELTSWANQFGTTAQQVGKTIEQTIGVSLQAVNQFLVTGKFNAQALLQQLILLGLQLVEQMIIQRVMAAINAAASVGQAAATGPIVAAAWAPAAAAATIATHGAAAAQAPASVATALALIQGMLVFAHEGGPIRRRRMHGGGLAPDEVPIIAQEGEIMIQRSVAQAPGMADFLLGLNAGMFHSGGFVAGHRYHRGGGGIDVGSNVFGPDSPFSPVPPWTEPPILHDPTDIPRGGPQVEIVREPGWSKEGGDPGRSASFFNRLITFGTSPPGGSPFGPTMIPTLWLNYPGVGPVPMAVPVGGWSPEAALHHMGQDVKTKHSGGLISRFHGGGSIGGGRAAGTGVHIYAFTDLKALTKHMASKDGQKIIFDTVKGRRIDLGIS